VTFVVFIFISHTRFVQEQEKMKRKRRESRKRITSISFFFLESLKKKYSTCMAFIVERVWMWQKKEKKGICSLLCGKKKIIRHIRNFTFVTTSDGRKRKVNIEKNWDKFHFIYLLDVSWIKSWNLWGSMCLEF
jgi:hypothetical protein